MGNIKQTLKLDNITSSSIDIEFSVLQGSMMGPILYIIYINDLRHMECEGEFNK